MEKTKSEALETGGSEARLFNIGIDVEVSELAKAFERNSPPSERMRAAFHQAGHAVIAVHLRAPFEHVTLGDDAQKLGPGCENILLKTPVANSTSESSEAETERFEQAVLAEVIVRFAGTAARERFIDQQDPSGDLDAVAALFMKLHPETAGNANFRNWLARCKDAAEELVGFPYIRIAIQMVAFILESRGRLFEQEVRAIYRFCRSRRKLAEEAVIGAKFGIPDCLSSPH